MSRFVDRGANVAAVVGIGMALTIAVSFLMVIPIDPAYLVLAPLSGLLIGWYGNQRAEQLRSRPGRVLANAAWSGAITAVTFAVLFLGVKLFFFSLDPGYRDERSGGSFTCAAGPACVYERYQAADGGAASALDAVREAVEDERRAERAEQKLGQGAAPVEEAEEGAEEDLEWGDEEE